MKHYISQISRNWALPAIMLVGLLSSCKKEVLKETPLDFLAPQNAYTTVAGIRQGISGLHYSVRLWWYYGDEVGGTEDVGAIMKGLGSDVAYHGEDPNST